MSIKIKVIKKAMCLMLASFLFYSWSSQSESIDKIEQVVRTLSGPALPSIQILDKKQPNKKLHIMYAHYLDSGDGNSIENFKFFIHFAYEPCHPDISYTFIFNVNNPQETNLIERLSGLVGKEAADKMNKCAQNTRLIVRQNKPGGDLCAFVEHLKTDEWKAMETRFSYFFFINSSVRGPFLPVYYLKNWWEMFIDLFNKYPQAAAVGPYLSCETNPHIQSFIQALDNRGLAALKEVWRCPTPNEDRMKWIIDTEVKLGLTIITKGFELQSFISKYKTPNATQCYPRNPTFSYPVTHDEKKLIYRSDNPPDVSINVHEVVWVKFGGNIVYHKYVKEYVPLYTQLAYQNLKYKQNLQ